MNDHDFVALTEAIHTLRRLGHTGTAQRLLEIISHEFEAEARAQEAGR